MLVRRGLVVVGLALATLVLGLECARYLVLDAYHDHIEGNIAIAAWDYAQGVPLYAIQDGAPRLANFYGPLAYLAQLPALLLIGPGVMASKVTGVVALVATILLMAIRFFRGPPAQALNGFFLLVAGLTAISPTSFWTRPDPLETLLVALGVVSAASPLMVGVCIGLAVNLKVHAFIYFVPIVLELCMRCGWRSLMLLGTCAGAIFLAPFLLPGVSLPDYATLLGQQVMGRHLTAEHLATLIAYFIILFLPVALPLVRRQLPREPLIYGVASLATLGLLLYPATFPGAGPYHFLPLLPVLAEARRRLPVGGIGSEFAVFPILLFASATTQFCLDRIVERRNWGELADEAVHLARSSPVQPTEIGYGDTKRSYEIAQLAKAKLAFSGSPPWIDAQILMELRMIGIDGSRRWIHYASECQVARWVLPKDEQAFAIQSYFYDNAPLFGDGFRDAFAARYRLGTTSVHFAIWECRD